MKAKMKSDINHETVAKAMELFAKRGGKVKVLPPQRVVKLDRVSCESGYLDYSAYTEYSDEPTDTFGGAI